MLNARQLRGGFSLLELIVVLAVMGVMATATTGYMLAAKPHAQLEQAELELIANLNGARNLAISEEAQVRVRFDTTVTPNDYWVQRYDSTTAAWVNSGGLFELPTGVTLSANTFPSQIVNFNTRGGLVVGGALTLHSSASETYVINGNLASGHFQYGGGNTR